MRGKTNRQTPAPKPRSVSHDFFSTGPLCPAFASRRFRNHRYLPDLEQNINWSNRKHVRWLCANFPRGASEFVRIRRRSKQIARLMFVHASTSETVLAPLYLDSAIAISLRWINVIPL